MNKVLKGIIANRKKWLTKNSIQDWNATDTAFIAESYAKYNKLCAGKEFECELATMLENLPQNRPIYKDSGLWQIRTDDMEDVIFEQGVEESFFAFIKRAYDKENSLMSAFDD